MDFNWFSPGSFEGNFIEVNFKLELTTDGSGISVEIDFRLMLLDLSSEKSTLVQVIAWCRQAAIHYLSQCWPSSISPYGVTRPQWVKEAAPPWLQQHNNPHYDKRMATYDDCIVISWSLTCYMEPRCSRQSRNYTAPILWNNTNRLNSERPSI